VTCSADQSQTAETSGTLFNGSCTNDAGLSTDADSLTVKLDKTAPTAIAFDAGNLITEGSYYYFGSVPTGPSSCDADYDISGSAGCVVTGGGLTVGSHTFVATATDLAGNSYTFELNYTVLAWTLNGFYHPVDMGGVWNVVKGGSTVPLKFEVFAGSTELTTTSSVVGFSAGATACPTNGYVGDLIEVLATGGTVLRYDGTSGQFIFNWQTPKKPGACYQVTMMTADHSTLVAKFILK
jgi:hypothetical protein